jgi:arylsulfatase A-like enzyme
MVGTWYFLPTACEIARIQPSAEIDGISYLPILMGKHEEQKRHDYFYWEVNESAGPIQAILKGNWKGIKFYEKPFELYNLKDDLAETENLAGQFPEIVKDMEELMMNSRTEHPEFPLTKRKSYY